MSSLLHRVWIEPTLSSHHLLPRVSLPFHPAKERSNFYPDFQKLQPSNSSGSDIIHEFRIMVVSNPRGVEEESKSSQQQPWLLKNDGKNCSILQKNMFNNKPPLLYNVVSETPEFLGRTVGCSFGEWVLLTARYTNDVLVNLSSKETIELPFRDFTFDFCALTSHPSDPTCHIVYFTKANNALIICQPGDKEFTIKNWDYPVFPSRFIAVVAGKLVLSIPEMSFLIMFIVEFKESTYSFEWIEMERVIRLTPNVINFYFEYAGELFGVDRIMSGLSTNVIGYEICKADFLKKKWVTVNNLGRVAIFICYGTAVVQPASAESGIKPNSIYFLEDGDIYAYYIYNLGEGTIRRMPAVSSMEIETAEDLKLYWIMMHCDASYPKLLEAEIENRSSGEEMEEVGMQNSWSMVPQELLNLIQLHLFGRDHAVFRVVCKPWQQVSILDYSIPALLPSTALLELCQTSSPLLMFQEDMTISNDSVPIFRFFDPVHRKLYRMGIPELREAYIHHASDGWLLLSRCSEESIFFFNPLTQEKIDLPKMPSASHFYACTYSLSFSSLPTCSNCLVVGICHSAMLMYTLQHGEETWRRHDTDQYQSKYMVEYCHCPVVRNGLHNFMCYNRHVVVFNVKVFPSKFHPKSPREEDFFLEIDGALAFASIGPLGGEISIYKWNRVKKDWQRMKKDGVDFGGKQMFVSKKGSFMEKIDDVGGMGNIIFLPMIDSDAKDGVFYSLTTQRYHTFCSGYSSEVPDNVDQFPNGIWIKPNKKIVGDENLKWTVRRRTNLQHLKLLVSSLDSLPANSIL